MKAAIFNEFGEPEKVLHEGELPIPKPKQGEVLVKTILGAVHNHNVSIVRGTYGYKPQLPAAGGTEGVGIIEEVGEGVTNFKKGQRVVTSVSSSGTWAEYFTASASFCVPIPDSIPDEAAAQLISMPISALMLLEFLKVSKDNYFIYNCANGVVGKLMAAVSKNKGLNMIKVVRSEKGKKELDDLGLGDNVIIADNDEDYTKKVQEITKGAEVVSGVDSVGGITALHLLRALSDNARLVSFGSLTSKPMEISSGDMIFGQKSVVGFWTSHQIKLLSQEQRVQYIQEIVKLVASKELVLETAGVYSFAQAKEAMQKALGHKVGKVLFKP